MGMNMAVADGSMMAGAGGTASASGKLKEKDKADEEEAKLRTDLDKKGGLSNMPHEKLVEENVHLTKLLLEVS